jgi:hypothetical protein
MLDGFGKSRSGSGVERFAARMHHASDYVFRWHVEA